MQNEKQDKDRLIFLTEADDDLQEILSIDKRGLIRRIHCYVLLSDGIILHPAYIWQSRITNEIVLGHISETLSPSLFRILLGDSTSIKQYITERMRRLSPRKLGQTLYEYHQYKRWGGDILVQASTLDKTFRNTGPVLLAESRDKKFRRLLVSDVSENIDPNSLYSLTSKFIMAESLKMDLMAIVSKLQDYVESSDLVSVESFSSYVASLGLNRLSMSQVFMRRMLDIYYHANVEERISVPGLRIISNRIIDPFDVDVFWAVFAKLFGRRTADALSGGYDEKITRTVLEIREASAWQSFRAIYYSVLEEIEASLWNNTSLVQKRIEDATGFSSVTIVKRIWREKRLEIAGAIFGIIGIGTIPISPLSIQLAIVQFSVGIGSLFLSAATLVGPVTRFIHEYHKNDLTTLRHRIAKAVEAAVEGSLQSRTG